MARGASNAAVGSPWLPRDSTGSPWTRESSGRASRRDCPRRTIDLSVESVRSGMEGNGLVSVGFYRCNSSTTYRTTVFEGDALQGVARDHVMTD